MTISDQSAGNQPLISVMMPAYNAGNYLSDAILSVLGQTHRNIELLCLDDGSTDCTARLLAEMAERDPRIKTWRTENRGISSALNDCLARANGSFVARMDADDVCLPDRLEKQLAYLADHPEVGVVGTQFLTIDSKNAPVKFSTYPLEDPGIKRGLMRGRCPLLHPSVLGRREIFEEVGGYRDRVSEDYDLFLRMAGVTTLGNLSEPLLLYRVSEAGLKMSKLRKNHASIIDSLAEIADSRGDQTVDLPAVKQWLNARDQHLERNEALLKKQIRHALQCGNYRTARCTGRRLLQKLAVDWRVAGCWLRAELAGVAGKGNKGEALVNRAFSSVSAEKARIATLS